MRTAIMSHQRSVALHRSYLSSCVFLLVITSGVTFPSQACLRRTQPTSKISTRGKWLTDIQGRVRLFHGFNAVSKAAPWYPANLLNDTRLDLYQAWGFNVVRMGVMWSGAQPHQASFNQTYYNVLKSIITKLEVRGIYVILDFHQDVLSSRYGTYDGVPLWLLDKLPPSKHAFPWPIPPGHETSWSTGYLSEAAGRAFQGIYDNVAGTRDWLAQFWRKTAEEFRGFPNVLGYELFNEPWCGDIYARPDLLLPGQAGRVNLQDLYDHLIQEITGIDASTLIFYEPVTWGVFLNGNLTGTGFAHAPGGAANANRSVLSYHYYCWIMGRSSFQRALCDRFLTPDLFRAVERDVSRLGGSSFLSEFGLCQTNITECVSTMRTADDYLQSWTYWDSDFFDDAGNVNHNVVSAFSRPYARATHGEPMQMYLNESTGQFSFQYKTNDVDCQLLSTEIFVSMYSYPCGFDIEVSSGLSWLFDERKKCLYIYHDVISCYLHSVDVILTPKSCS